MSTITKIQLEEALARQPKDQVLSFSASKNWTAIYFLCSADRIQYVGKAQNVFGRIQTHKQNPEMRPFFDNIVVYFCEEKHVNELEGAFIAALKPTFNKTKGAHLRTAMEVLNSHYIDTKQMKIGLIEDAKRTEVNYGKIVSDENKPQTQQNQ